jgi:CHASE3 domain sensor protein
VLVVVAVAVIATTVWEVGHLQRDTVTSSFRQTEAAHAILTAMLDQETSLRGFLQTEREDFLEPYREGDRQLAAALASARRNADSSNDRVQRLVDRAETVARRWRRSADAAILASRSPGRQRVAVDDVLGRKAQMDDLRATVARLQGVLEAERARALDHTSNVSALLIVAISVLFSVAGWLAIGRPAAVRARRDRSEARRRDRQALFARSLQFMDSEEETHGLVQRHLEQSIDGSGVVVLQRNNSADRLEATTALPEGHPLVGVLETAAPRDCLAVRLGAPRSSTSNELLNCAVCGRSERELTICTPLLVSGEVIGSVLVEHDEELDESAPSTSRTP